MKACRVHRFGAPDVISYEDIDRPQPAAGEVLVKVAAAGVGPWDGWIRAGKSALPQPLPLTLGSDLSGVVEACGSEVTGLAIGDAVFGVTNAQFTGAYADYTIASAGMIAPKPSSLGDIDAASLPVVAATAWQALFDQAQLQAGQSVLIHGAAGNVGSFAVQFAREAGLDTIATATSNDIEYVRGLGARNVNDFRAERFEDVVGKVDAVIDLVGGDTQARSFAVLTPNGRLISTVSPPDQKLAQTHSVTAAFFLVGVANERLTQIAALLAAGKIVTQVGTVLDLPGARIAHEMLEGMRPRQRGKIVLKVTG